MMRLFVIAGLISLFFAFSLPLSGQHSGKMNIKAGESNYGAVSFDLINNLIIVPVRINGSDPLHFILDTGVKNTLITQLYASDTLHIKDATKVEIRGHGAGEPLQAYRTKNNTLEIGGVRGEGFEVSILFYDIFNLSKQLGRKVHGIIGFDVFKNFVVSINYQAEKIKFFRSDDFDKWWVDWFYQEHPIEIYNKKPYIKMRVKMHEDSPLVPVNMLMDTGSSETLWLFENSSDSLDIPERKRKLYIGRGLNGNVLGWRSRIYKAFVGDNGMNNPIVAFPDSGSIRYAALRKSRNGTVGADILHRFNVIFDYGNEKIYLRRNANYYKPFRHNTTGLVLKAEVPGLPVYEVSYVRDSSNAYREGIREGDQVVQVNEKQVVEYSLEEINKVLNSFNPGERLSIWVLRNGVRKRFRFRAEDIIGDYRREKKRFRLFR